MSNNQSNTIHKYGSLDNEENCNSFQKMKKNPVDQNKQHGTLLSSIATLSATCMGAGIMTLPHALQDGGWLAGTLTLIIFAVASDVSLIFLLRSSLASGYESFSDLGFGLYGRSGRWIVQSSLLILLYLAAIIILINCQELTECFFDQLIWPNSPNRGALWTGICVLVVFPLTCFKKLVSLRHTSTAAVASLGYVFLALAIESLNRNQPFSNISWKYAINTSKPMHIFLCLPLQSLAFCCQFNILPLYSELRKEDRKHAEKIVHISIGIVCIIYMFFGIFGYLICGPNVPTNILTASQLRGRTLITIGVFAVAVTNILKYPLILLPLRSIINITMRPIVRYLWSCIRQRTSIQENSVEDSRELATYEIVIQMIAINLSIYGLAVALRTMTNGFNVLGCTAGGLICFILPGMYQYQSTKKKVFPLPSIAMIAFGVIVSLLTLIATIQLWNT